MRFYEATSRIAASPEAVWAVLSDGPGWTRWDSGVEGFEGRIELGGKVTIRSAAAPGRAFPVKVTAFEPPGRLCFSGGMPLGLFRGVRTFHITADPAADGADATSFRVREEYSGPLVGLVWRSTPDLQPSFDRFAEGLRRRVEAGS
jgi:uncharacterized protein YndB with AHSA1/START domain